MSSSSGILRSSVMPAASHIDESAKYPTDSSSQTYSLLFYGTLVHPAILARMIGHQGSNLIVQPAILEGYALHHVKGEDYPGLIPLSDSQKVLSQGDPGHSSKSPTKTAIRGMLVEGLSEADVLKLDRFEGNEYIRQAVNVLLDESVQPLKNDQRSESQSIDQVLSSLTPERIQTILNERRASKRCHVYRWYASTDMLEPRIWTFETFMSSGNHHKWWNDA
ncbi:uncharacterized protein FA14DRAFT_159121 [Meira miltonrushii]|uniref:Putative gamma-glutamylcyclotransferase n=1 Tax=Meira miltonrushii TaxID=1280837 RepID=A0A316VGK6_9BASI|nr:uncharacterized protein FA14DRAFT_159121 [Meira miltonrushii]PWN36722.1 hypothetical protein FA14DRAFT_159121 [Meira miltonrushii]